MGHKNAIVFVVAYLIGAVTLSLVLNFLSDQFGLWFTLPTIAVILGTFYWMAYHS